MTLTEMVAALRLDLEDPLSEEFTDQALQRSLTRATVPVSKDSGYAISFASGTLTVVGEDGFVVSDATVHFLAESLSLMAQIYACEQKTSQAASQMRRIGMEGGQSIEFGDQAKSWSDLAKSLRLRYDRMINQINPAESMDAFIKPPMYEVLSFHVGGRGGHHGTH